MTLSSLVPANIKQAINNMLGYLELQLIDRKIRYAEDGLHTIHNHSFLQDEHFINAIEAVESEMPVGWKNKLRYRNYIAIKLAEHARSISKTFCECGVGDGVISLSILHYFRSKGIELPKLFLLDTFEGLDETLVPSDEEKFWGMNATEKKCHYKSIYDSDLSSVKRRFDLIGGDAEFVQGPIPNTITDELISSVVSSGPISFLHIDLNNSVPEVASLKAFFPLMNVGGIVLFDDYAYCGYEFQKAAIDNACNELRVPIPMTLPTGQGLLIKPW